MVQYLPYLRSNGFMVEFAPLLPDGILQTRYVQGRYSLLHLASAFVSRLGIFWKKEKVNALWIEKELFPWLPFWLERLLLGKIPYVLDYDDAVFHQYDQHQFWWVRRMYGNKLDRLMTDSALVVAGNAYLAHRAQVAGAKHIYLLPTAIDLDRYIYPRVFVQSGGLPRIVWIGSPSTAAYLQLIAEALGILANRIPFILRLIGCPAMQIAGVKVEVVSWTEDTEVASIRACDIGVMPLSDSPWTRGKCGYKLIQYMACGLPVVASPVGANLDILDDGINGYFADSPDAWVAVLSQLLEDQVLRFAMGAKGREKVEQNYCIQKTAPELSALLQSVTQEYS
jgi:glycosyltransferase involved in cell wall biosynthesis